MYSSLKAEEGGGLNQVGGPQSPGYRNGYLAVLGVWKEK